MLAKLNPTVCMKILIYSNEVKLISGMQEWHNISESINMTLRMNKNSLIISIDAEKASDKNQYPIRIKTPIKLIREWEYLTKFKAAGSKPKLTAYWRGQVEGFPSPRCGTRQILTSTTLVQKNTGDPNWHDEVRERNKGLERKQWTVRLYSWHNLKQKTSISPSHTIRINELSQVSQYKINMQRSGVTTLQ